MKKGIVIHWIGNIIIAILFLTMAGIWFLFGTQIKAANSIEKLEDGLYALEYRGDYGLDQFIEGGGAASEAELAGYLTGFLSHGFYKETAAVQTGDFGCSTICVENKTGGTLFGRNFDWEKGDALIIHSKPKNGYESISTCLINFLGFGEDFHPDGSMIERMQTLAALYVPLDGMNEKGLMVADLMAGDHEATHQDSGKTDVTTTTAIRLLLDRAEDVDEAIELLSQVDMHSSIDSAHHLSIADASGKSVVVEYIDGEMLVTETDVVTNHYLSDCMKKGTGSEQSHLRYSILAEQQDPVDETGAKNLLKSVAQMNFSDKKQENVEKTLWSIVYIPEGLCADFYFMENYEHSYGLLLHEKGSVFVKR